MIPELSRIADPAYLAGLTTVSADELREMRFECADLENAVSYVRRLAQGRLDVLNAEMKQRSEGAGGDLADLVENLPEMLSDGVRGPGSGRISQELDPPEQFVDPLVEVLDASVSPGVVADVAELGDDALSAAVIALRRFEDRLSTSRHQLHDTIDSLNNDLARRIAAGESGSAPA